MAASRTLKLSILADVDQLKKSLGVANNSVDSSAAKMRDFGKKAALALAAAGAAAVAFAAKSNPSWRSRIDCERSNCPD